MKILALEFSTSHRSVALLEVPNEKSSIINHQSSMVLIASHSEEAKRGGSPFPLISKVLGSHHPDALAIGLGPGSYTGIRSSLAIAQGWNLAHGTLAAGVSSADAIAHQAWTNGLRGPIEVVIDAQRTEVYSACYELTQTGFTETQPLAILTAPRGLGQLIGPEATRYSPSGQVVFPTGAATGSLVGKTAFCPSENLQPIYLRETAFVKASPPSPTH